MKKHRVRNKGFYEHQNKTDDDHCEIKGLYILCTIPQKRIYKYEWYEDEETYVKSSWAHTQVNKQTRKREIQIKYKSEMLTYKTNPSAEIELW